MNTQTHTSQIGVAINTCATLSTARTLLGVDDPTLHAMMDDGRIAFAINVGSRHAATREIRIPMRCLLDAAAGQFRDYTAEQIAADLWPNLPMIPAKLFYLALNIKHSHFYDTLVREGSITLAGLGRWRPGPGGSALIERRECINFLLTRRIL